MKKGEMVSYSLVMLIPIMMAGGLMLFLNGILGNILLAVIGMILGFSGCILWICIPDIKEEPFRSKLPMEKPCQR